MSLETHKYIENCPGDQEEVLDFLMICLDFFEGLEEEKCDW